MPAEWDVFQFCHALKHRSGMPAVLAVHYRDLLRFGIIPFGREAHRTGLDALLVGEPIPVELEYFSAEMSAAGVGVAFPIGRRRSRQSAMRLARYASAFRENT